VLLESENIMILRSLDWTLSVWQLSCLIWLH